MNETGETGIDASIDRLMGRMDRCRVTFGTWGALAFLSWQAVGGELAGERPHLPPADPATLPAVPVSKEQQLQALYAAGKEEAKAKDWAAAAGPEGELVLLPGPGGGKVASRAFKPLARPYQPWKLDWENYIHKDFFPLINDFQVSGQAADGGPPAIAVDGGGRPLGAPIQAVQMLWLRCFPVAEGQASQLLRTKPRNAPLPSDWRGHAFLRWDVKFSQPAHVWLAIEDKAVYPPVVGNYDVPAETWTTLEIDLEQAARKRGLDLGSMWMLWARVSMNAGDYAWRNLRLAQRDTPAAHPVLADARAAELPAHPPKQAAPVPDVARAAAWNSPRTLIYRSETEIEMAFKGQDVSAQVVAYDAERVLLVLTDKDPRFGWQSTAGKPIAGRSRDELFAVQTLDGGQTWTGLDGDKDRSYLFAYMKPLTQVVDPDGNAIVWNENGCDNNPGPRRRLIRLTFLGKHGWTYNRKDYIFDSEAFHCGFQKRKEDTVRVASGRIWAVAPTEHRLIDPAAALYAKYSDDDGRNWHSWQEGRIAMIPGSGNGSDARVVPFGPEIAVFWRTPKEAENPLHYCWSCFDGKTWSAPQIVHGGYVSGAATVDEKEMLLSVGNYSGNLAVPGGKEAGIKQFDGRRWMVEFATPSRGLLCVCGRSVAAVSASAKNDALIVRWRSPAGKWDAEPQTIATGPLAAFHVPRFGPPDCVPVLYMNKDDRQQAKVLLAPNKHAGAK